MARIEAPSLRDYIANTSAQKAFWDPAFSVTVADLNRGTSLGGLATDLTGHSVLVATARQLTTALALIELDGRARRLTILPPNIDIDRDHLGSILASAEIDAVVVDSDAPQVPTLDFATRAVCRPALVPAAEPHRPAFAPNGYFSRRVRRGPQSW